MVEARQREKEEEARAREKIRAKLGEGWVPRGACLPRRSTNPGEPRAGGMNRTCDRCIAGLRGSWCSHLPHWSAEEDRRERRRKLGLPEELTEEEKEEERRKAAVRDSGRCRGGCEGVDWT